MEEFKVTIDQFEGPLDLMLHLIKEKELDIFDLDVNVLTDEYISYLNAMTDMHLEVASEYLVELAELIEYKSRKLLPQQTEDDPDNYEEDPKDRLVRRLLEYQQFKEVTNTLEQMYEDRQELLGKPLSEESEQWSDQSQEPAHYEGNPYELMRAMMRVMRRMQLSRPIETKFTRKEISMEDRELEIRARLDHLPQNFRFEQLLEDVHDLPMFIATFLAVLDLARLHTLVFTVNDQDEIWFSRGAGLA
ncbi:MAG: segregation/condensation protein A [Stecheria intestinalis]|nr:segregation/condensation protein A [Stecheria intestinalis]